MAKKVSRKGKKGYAKYKATYAFSTNKKKKLIKHLKTHPGDVVATKKLATNAFSYSRTKPGSRTWKRSKSKMEYAHILSNLGYTAAQIISECFFKNKEQKKVTVKEES